MYAIFLGKAVQTVNPPNASVGASQIVDASITSGKLASGVLPTNTPSFMVYRSTVQTIATSTGTKVQFQTEVFDSDNAYDNATNYRFTVPSGKAGKYLFGYGIMSTTNTTGRFYADIFKNGTNGFATDEIAYTQYDTLGKTAVLDLSVGDYIEVYVTQFTGGNIDLYQDGQGRTYFFGYKIIE